SMMLTMMIVQAASEPVTSSTVNRSVDSQKRAIRDFFSPGTFGLLEGVDAAAGLVPPVAFPFWARARAETISTTHAIATIAAHRSTASARGVRRDAKPVVYSMLIASSLGECGMPDVDRESAGDVYGKRVGFIRPRPSPQDRPCPPRSALG